MSSTAAALQTAFELADQATKLDARFFDSRAGDGAADEDASETLAQQAMELYLASIKAFFQVLPAYASADPQTAALIQQNVNFFMERVECIVDQGRDVSVLPPQRAAPHDESPDKKMTREEKRTLVAREMRDTEQVYLNGLRKLVQHYAQPLQAIIGVAQAKAVFGNVEEIAGLSETFLSMLAARVEAWNEHSTMGDVFKRYAPFFKIYSMYTSKYESGLQYLGSLFEKNRDAAQVQAAALAAGAPEISSLMITPVQRIPRLVLLLKELRKRTAEGHPDERELDEALAEFKKIAGAVNERLKKEDENKKVLDVQESLWSLHKEVPELLSPGRYYVREGLVSKIRSAGSLKRLYLIAFSDMLVYASPPTPLLPGRYHYKGSIEYYGVFDGDDEARRLGHLETGQGAFRVTGPKGERVFVVASVLERNAWMEALQRCVDEREDRRRSRGV